MSAAALPRTPFETGNGNQSTSWEACIAFYEALAAAHPQALRFWRIGTSDGGSPMHAGVVTADGCFDPATLHAQQRPVFFNNNGIHPGEPEGIDACMALVRDLCNDPARRAALGRTAFLFVPVYNVDGCRDRNDRSRANQVGPEQFGFRGNALHLDLNRDFVKCDSSAARVFTQLFAEWDPDVMVDTHTSNGADYAYTMTLIATQPDKLGGALGEHLRTQMLPAIYAAMGARGWPTCPYVNPVGRTPDEGIADFLDTPRYSTGFAALHHTIGFMPETHMLKPYADRYASMRALVDVCLDWTVAHGERIGALRRAARATPPAVWPLRWRIDMERATPLRFRGYRAVERPSRIGRYQRLTYDRQQPWEREIPHHDHALMLDGIAGVAGYLIPQAWREPIERLAWNGLRLQRLTRDITLSARVHRVEHATCRPLPYEGRAFFDELALTTATEPVTAQAGDFWVPLAQARARYAVETLEPMAHDSFFRWGFFASVLERKEHYSDYVFEDTAEAMLRDEPGLREAFERWAAAEPGRLDDAQLVLDFIHAHGRRHAEPAYRRHPVFGLSAPPPADALGDLPAP